MVPVCFCVFREEYKVKGHIEDKQLQYVGWSTAGSAMVSVSPAPPPPTPFPLHPHPPTTTPPSPTTHHPFHSTQPPLSTPPHPYPPLSSPQPPPPPFHSTSALPPPPPFLSTTIPSLKPFPTFHPFHPPPLHSTPPFPLSPFLTGRMFVRPNILQNYESFLNWTFTLLNMVWTGQTLLHSQLACNEMQASARTCGRRAADSMIKNVG